MISKRGDRAPVNLSVRPAAVAAAFELKLVAGEALAVHVARAWAG
jgi:hypothetical protein